MKNILFIITFLVLSLAKDNTSDHLKWSELSKQHLDSLKYTGNFHFADSTFKYANSFLKWSEVNGDIKNQGDAYHIIGLTYYHTTQIDSAISYLQIAEGLFTVLKDTINIINTRLEICKCLLEIKAVTFADSIFDATEKMIIASSNANPFDYMGIIAGIYSQYGHYKRGIDHYLSSAIFRDTAHERNRVIRGFYCLGDLYCYSGQYQEAVYNYSRMLNESLVMDMSDKELAIWESTYMDAIGGLILSLIDFEKNPRFIALASHFFERERLLTQNPDYDYEWGKIFSTLKLAKIHYYKNDLIKAYEYYLLSFRELSEVWQLKHADNDRRLIGNVLREMGRLDIKLDEPGRAIKLLNQSLKIHKGMRNIEEIIRTYNGYGEYYLSKGYSDSAIVYLSLSEILADGRGFNFSLADTYSLMSKAHLNLGNISASSRYHEQSEQIRSEVYENLNAAVSAIISMQLLERTSELVDLNQNNRYDKLYYLLLTVIGVVVLVGYRSYRKFWQNGEKNQNSESNLVESLKTCNSLFININEKDLHTFYLSNSESKDRSSIFTIRDVDMSFLLFLAIERLNTAKDGENQLAVEKCWLDHNLDDQKEIKNTLANIVQTFDLPPSMTNDVENYEKFVNMTVKQRNEVSSSWIFKTDLRKHYPSTIKAAMKIRNTSWRLFHSLKPNQHLVARYILNPTLKIINIE